MSNIENQKGQLLILLAGTLWGTTGVFSHLLADLGYSPKMAAMFRLLGAVVLMAPLMAVTRKGAFRITRHGLILALIQGVTTQLFFSTAYMTSIAEIGMSSAAVLLYTSPIYVMIYSKLVFREKIGRIRLLALVLDLMGCILTVTGGSFSLEGLSLFGVAAGLFAGLSYATLPILSRYATESDSPDTISIYSMTAGVILIALVARPWAYQGGTVNLRLLVIVLVCGALSTAAPYFAYVSGAPKLRATSMAPVLASVENISASLLGVLVFGEIMTPLKGCGIALVLLSVFLMNRSGSESIKES